MKSIMFKTKIFHEVKMYLLVSDVTKMMEISEKAFCKKYSDKIVEIPGCRKCIAETDFNLLISDDKELFKKMGMLASFQMMMKSGSCIMRSLVALMKYMRQFIDRQRSRYMSLIIILD